MCYVDGPLLDWMSVDDCNHSSSGNDTWFPTDPFHIVAHCLTLYLQPAMCLFGVIGNVISLMVFLSKKLRTVSCNVYLAALSASNSVFMIMLFIVWLEMLDVRLVHQNGWCQVVIYGSYICSFLSVWLIVCITIENFIITFHLHDAPRLCTVGRAALVVGGLTFFALLLYDFALWTTLPILINENNMTYCMPPQMYEIVVSVFTLVDVFLTLILPCLLIISFLIAIIVKNISQPSGLRTNLRRVLKRKERALLRVTRLLLVITVSFMCLSAPSHVNKLIHVFSVFVASGEASQYDHVIQQLCQLFYYASFSCNFIYYLIWGKNFRHVLSNIVKNICRCCWRPDQRT